MKDKMEVQESNYLKSTLRLKGKTSALTKILANTAWTQGNK